MIGRFLRSQAPLVAHRIILARMSLEALLSRFGKARKQRVLATACWHFPIYSQTFVYRETSALAKDGFELRFAYSGLATRGHLPDECAALWKMKRRLILSDATATADLEHYKRRNPERVHRLATLIGEASGLNRNAVFAHPHFREAFSFTRMAECWKADYIHTYFFYERTIFGMVASYMLEIPRGISCYADHMLDDYELKLVAANLQSCDVIVATSGRIKRELEALAGQPLPAAIVKPNGIDSTQFAGGERLLPVGGRVFRLASVSRIHAKKGLVYLLEAALLLYNRHLLFHVNILGEPDDHDARTHAYYVELKDFVANHGLDSVISFQGRKTAPEVKQYLLKADVFVAPFVELPNGDKDGIPTALLEAMAAGCAIVSTDAGSISEVIEDGVDGIIVPQFDSAGLADAIERLINDDGLRARISKAAIKKVRKQFDVSHCEDAFHQRVRGAVESPKRDRDRVTTDR